MTGGQPIPFSAGKLLNHTHEHVFQSPTPPAQGRLPRNLKRLFLYDGVTYNADAALFANCYQEGWVRGALHYHVGGVEIAFLRILWEDKGRSWGLQKVFALLVCSG